MRRLHQCRIAMLCLPLLAGLAGCQSQPHTEPTSSAPDTSQAKTASDSQRTPDGDRLDGPIPYGHWPYNIQRGGGGGEGR